MGAKWPDGGYRDCAGLTLQIGGASLPLRFAGPESAELREPSAIIIERNTAARVLADIDGQLRVHNVILFDGIRRGGRHIRIS